MSYHFRPAKVSSAKMLVGIYSESGHGKTFSALLVALGFVGPKGRIGMIETESGRGEIYQGVTPEGFGDEWRLQYEACSIAGNFAPEEYGKAISAAEAAKFDALIIDSASHEWESVGGVLDMAAKNQAEGKKGPLVWQRPKIDHAKHFVLRLMSSPIPLIIVNMRAKYPMEQITEKYVAAWKAAGGTGQQPKVGEWARSLKLEPKQSDDILFEMLIHGWIDEQHRYHVTKYPKAIPQLREVVRDGEPLGIVTGQRLARWAAGAATPKQAAPAGAQQSEQQQGSTTGGGPQLITEEQAMQLDAWCSERGIPIEAFKKRARVNKVSELQAEHFEAAKAWIMAQKPADQQL